MRVEHADGRPLVIHVSASLVRTLSWAAIALLVQPVAVAQRGHGSFDRSAVGSAREQPDSVREALFRTFRNAASAATHEERSAHLQLAHRLAEEYAEAWRDDFLLRQVVSFQRSSLSGRRERVTVDSLRRAGNAALGSQGAIAAMRAWRESLRRALALGDPSAIAPALAAVGAGYYRLDQSDSAIAYLRRAESLASRIGDRRTEGNAIGILASVRKDQGELEEAARLYRQASVIRVKSGDTRGLAADQNNLGSIAEELGDLHGAADAYGRALSMNRRDGRTALVALNLSNLAGVATTEGYYARAETLYREALALHVNSGSLAENAFVRHGLGKLYMSRGDYRMAAAELREAIRTHESAGALADAIEARVDLAAVETARGNPETARVLLRDAGRLSASSPAENQAALALGRADLAIQFGTFRDADADYARAVRLSRRAGDSAGLARGLEGQALLFHWRGDDARSLALLEDAARLNMSIGDRRAAALTMLLAADVRMRRADFSASRRSLYSATKTLQLLGDAAGEAEAIGGLGELALREGALETADSLYRLGLRTLGSRQASQIRWRLHSGLGETLHRRGSPGEAAAEFRAAIAITEQTVDGVRLEERRSAFLAGKWEPYTQLALIEQYRGRAAEAFAVSERMRARQLLELLARGRVASPARPSRQEQDLRRRIDVLTRRLETSGRSGQALRERPLAARNADATRADLDRAQKEYARLLEEIRESDAAYSALVSPRTRSWREVAARLKPHEVFLEYLVTDSTSVVFVITADTVAALDLRLPRQPLADLLEFSRKTMNRPPTSGRAEAWRPPLRRLYLSLLQPIEDAGYLRGKTRLLIAPHAELHFLSFASLIAPGARDAFLVERFEIAYAPSARIWLQLGERRFRPPAGNVLALAPNVKRLPGSEREAEAIGRIYGRAATVRRGAAATSAALRSGIPRSGVLHLATFGVLNKHNPLFSFVELAPGGGDDGRLEVNDVFALPLSGQLVVLSACQTALASGTLSDVPPGDDWVGLVQSFLHAGARSVVASLWPVEDRATADLMEHFHKELASGATPGSALAGAQRRFIARSPVASPAYWAAFTLSGSSE